MLLSLLLLLYRFDITVRSLKLDLNLCQLRVQLSRSSLSFTNHLLLDRLVRRCSLYHAYLILSILKSSRRLIASLHLLQSERLGMKQLLGSQLRLSLALTILQLLHLLLLVRLSSQLRLLLLSKGSLLSFLLLTLRLRMRLHLSHLRT